jgi:hypothetical protein
MTILQLWGTGLKNHFGPRQPGESLSHMERFVGVDGKIGWNEDLSYRVHVALTGSR